MSLYLRLFLRQLRIGLIPALAFLGLVFGLRFFGGFQLFEWRMLDQFLLWRSHEKIDQRIVLVTIDEQTIQSLGTYPIPDAYLVQLLKRLNSHNPRVIGVDIVRDLPVEPGHKELQKMLQEMDNLYGIEKVLLPTVAPPPKLPKERTGIADAFLDFDGRQRRVILGTQITPEKFRKPESNDFRFSLSLLLAKAYLSEENITLKNGEKNKDTMRFGKAEIPRLTPNFGGYVNLDAGKGDVQTLINFRASSQAFPVIRADDILNGNYNPEILNDRIILVGNVAPSVQDLFSAASKSTINNGLPLVYGLELHAHSISQILSATLDKRPLINALPEFLEYLLIALVGFAGMVIAIYINSPFRALLWGVIGMIAIVLISFLALIYGWWLPVFPALVLFCLNLLGLTTFYQQQKLLKEVATRNKLEGELEAGKIIQMSMLTQNGEAQEKQADYDLWAILKSAKTVSGDLYFFEEQKPDKLCFGVGDVADKGTPAALFMAKTMTLLNQVIGKESNPDRILQFINDELEKNNDNCMFVSLFCGVLNLKTGELHFASAGHKNPILIRNNQVVELEQNLGSALGLMEGEIYETNFFQMLPNDKLILYTDGVDETFNDDQEMLGMEGFIDSLRNCQDNSSEEIGLSILDTITNFRQNAPQSDDITIMILDYHYDFRFSSYP